VIGMCNGKDVGFHFLKTLSFLNEYDRDFYGTNWIPYEMEGVDIDTEEDWGQVERLLGERNERTNSGRDYKNANSGAGVLQEAGEV